MKKLFWKNTEKKIIINMNKLLIELFKTIENKYFTSEQLLYLLSFTPLSQRQSLLDYYKKLNSLNQSKTDLHSTLSDSHD